MLLTATSPTSRSPAAPSAPSTGDGVPQHGVAGYVYLGAFGFTASDGVIGMGFATILAPLVMYLMADRVWTWGCEVQS